MQPTPPQLTDPESRNGSVKPDRAAWWSVAKNVLSGLKGWQAVPAAVIALYCFLGIFGPSLAPFEPYRGTVATRLCPPLAIDALSAASNPNSPAGIVARPMFSALITWEETYSRDCCTVHGRLCGKSGRVSLSAQYWDLLSV